MTPVSIPTDAVTTLNVEPGAYRSRYAREVGLVGVFGQQLPVGRHRLGVVPGERRGVVGRVGVHREDLPGHRVDGHHRAALTAERVGGGALDVGAEREHHRAGRLFTAEQVGQALELELRVATHELVVVGLLHAGVAEDERLVPDHLAEQPALGVLALELELGAVVDLDRSREHHAVGRDDRAARTVGVAERGTHVAWVVLEVVGVDDLQVGELRDQHEHQHGDGDTDAADRSIHRGLLTRRKRTNVRDRRAIVRSRCRRRSGAAARGSRSWRRATTRRRR